MIVADFSSVWLASLNVVHLLSAAYCIGVPVILFRNFLGWLPRLFPIQLLVRFTLNSLRLKSSEYSDLLERMGPTSTLLVFFSFQQSFMLISCDNSTFRGIPCL